MENSIRLVSGDIHAQQVSVREIVSAAICLYPDISLSVCGSWFTETIFEVILFSVLLVIPFLLFFFTPACFTDTIFHRKAALLLYSSGALENSALFSWQKGFFLYGSWFLIDLHAKTRQLPT